MNLNQLRSSATNFFAHIPEKINAHSVQLCTLTVFSVGLLALKTLFTCRPDFRPKCFGSIHTTDKQRISALAKDWLFGFNTTTIEGKEKLSRVLAEVKDQIVQKEREEIEKLLNEQTSPSPLQKKLQLKGMSPFVAFLCEKHATMLWNSFEQEVLNSPKNTKKSEEEKIALLSKEIDNAPVLQKYVDMHKVRIAHKQTIPQFQSLVEAKKYWFTQLASEISEKYMIIAKDIVGNDELSPEQLETIYSSCILAKKKDEIKTRIPTQISKHPADKEKMKRLFNTVMIADQIETEIHTSLPKVQKELQNLTISSKLTLKKTPILAIRTDKRYWGSYIGGDTKWTTSRVALSALHFSQTYAKLHQNFSYNEKTWKAERRVVLLRNLYGIQKQHDLILQGINVASLCAASLSSFIVPGGLPLFISVARLIVRLFLIRRTECKLDIWAASHDEEAKKTLLHLLQRRKNEHENKRALLQAIAKNTKAVSLEDKQRRSVAQKQLNWMKIGYTKEGASRWNLRRSLQNRIDTIQESAV